MVQERPCNRPHFEPCGMEHRNIHGYGGHHGENDKERLLSKLNHRSERFGLIFWITPSYGQATSAALVLVVPNMLAKKLDFEESRTEKNVNRQEHARDPQQRASRPER